MSSANPRVPAVLATLTTTDRLRAKSGKVIEEEKEVANADDPAFKAKARITQKEAKRVALEKCAGKMIESEFSLESDGSPSYEFDNKTKVGKEWEVDAITSKLSEEPEGVVVWQIGGKE
jgi:uncharacterized membrane protein YkoI